MPLKNTQHWCVKIPKSDACRSMPFDVFLHARIVFHAYGTSYTVLSLPIKMI